MFIEMLEQLRCIEAHEESWLVATFHRLENRELIEGELGCHVCGARYPVTRGVAWFGVEPATIDALGRPTSEIDVLELAAFLNLAEHGKSVAVTGAFGAASTEIAERFGARVFAVNPVSDTAGSEWVGVLHTTRLFPLAPGSLDGIVLDADVGAEQAERAIVYLGSGGRLVLAAGLPVPAGVEVMARDPRFTVAQKLPPLTTLGRGSR